MTVTTDTPLHDYLRTMIQVRQMIPRGAAFNYWCPQDYVLDRGTVLASAPLTDDELITLLRAIDLTRMRFQYKQCFYNSQMVAAHDPTRTLCYCEGYAIGRSIQCHHAWLTINGKVVDLTWRTPKPNHKGRLRDRIFGVWPEHWQYIGIEFDTIAVLERMFGTGEVGSFIDDWKNGHPLLQQERLAPCMVEPLDIPEGLIGPI